MHADMPLDYPWWLRATHFFNFLFITLLVRSGLQVLASHPKLYWSDDARSFQRKDHPRGLVVFSVAEVNRGAASGKSCITRYTANTE